MGSFIRHKEKPFVSQFLTFMVFRLSSLIVVQTSYVPDEYWQSLEVAHNMTFGYGYLTWEWNEGLRSYLYPSLFSIFYKILKILHFDFPLLIIVIPKVVQSCLTALSDQYFLLISQSFNLNEYWIKIVIFTNWFWYYCGCRTITNAFETSLTTIALYYYPWELFIKEKSHNRNFELNWLKIKKDSLIYLSIAAGNCIIRPTAVTIWGPLVLFELLSLHRKYFKEFFFRCILPVGLFSLTFSIAIDYWWYGKFVFPPYNFFIFNIFKGISSFYGTHPVHWYITVGLPVVLGFHYLTLVIGLLSFLSPKKRATFKYQKVFGIIIFTFVLNIFILSYIPHKEFRFLLPLSPLMMLLIVQISTDFFKPSRPNLKSLWTLLLLIGFIIPTLLIGIFHQRGALSLMQYLRSSFVNCRSKCSFLFLMPCHSTPLYSHLHMNVTTKFLTCEPPLKEESYDEAADFFENPEKWLINNWNDNNIPSHVAFFDNIENLISEFLFKKGFIMKQKFLHTIFAKENMGRHILVYEPS